MFIKPDCRKLKQTFTKTYYWKNISTKRSRFGKRLGKYL